MIKSCLRYVEGDSDLYLQKARVLRATESAPKANAKEAVAASFSLSPSPAGSLAGSLKVVLKGKDSVKVFGEESFR